MKALPVVFILIWSTGFLVAKAIVPVADPNLFLTVRCVLAGLLFLGISLAARVRWPRWRQVPAHMLAGILLQGAYLGGTYWAVAHGLLPGVMALFGSLQPILTAVLGIVVLREIPSRRTWAGLALGACGVALVVSPGISTADGAAAPAGVIVVAVGAVIALTLGTILQKTSIAGSDIRASSVLQNAGSALFVGVIACVRGETRWISSPALWLSLGWASLVLSGLGTLMLVLLVRRGRAANVAALLLLAPPLAATESYLLFGDRLSALQVVGFAVTLAGVFLCNPTQRAANSAKTSGQLQEAQT